MESEIWRGIITSGPLAIVLAVACVHLWRDNRELRSSLVKCKDDCAAEQKNQSQRHEEKIEQLNAATVAIYKDLSDTLKENLGEKNG